MFTRASAIAACAAMLGVAAFSPAHAGGPRRSTAYLTFNRSVALPGVTLPAGTYIFERAEISNSSHVVQVSSRDRSRFHVFVLTNRIARPAGWPVNRPISFGEAPAGGVPPILVWYPSHEDFGHGFLYSTNR
jgi:hypothetical protein